MDTIHGSQQSGIGDVTIGKPGKAQSHICQAYADRVEVRGQNLTRDIMGRLDFTSYFHLLLTGREPTPEQKFFLDLLLIAIAEHGMMPTNVAARMTLAANPRALEGAVAAGLLGCGPVILGTTEWCADILVNLQKTIEEGQSLEAAVEDAVGSLRRLGDRMPGFGHPVHKPLDPRTERILELASEKGISGPHVALAKAFRPVVAKHWGKPLVMNVSMAIAAVLLDLGFDKAMVKAIPILARTASLLAHLAEERTNPIGFLMAGQAEAAIIYVRDEG